MAPSVKRCNSLREAALKILKSRQVSPRKVQQLVGYIVSLRPCLDPMALMFTKHMCTWVVNQVQIEGNSWDWRSRLGMEAREEVKVWAMCLDEWKDRPIWVIGNPDLAQAQDASDTAVGGWIGKYIPATQQLSKGKVYNVHWPEHVLMAVQKLSKRDQELPSAYRELWAIKSMFYTFVEELKVKWVRVQADNRSLYFIASKGASGSKEFHELLVELFWFCKHNKVKWDMGRRVEGNYPPPSVP